MSAEGGPATRLREADVAWREVDGDIVVLDLRSASYLRLNASAALLWHGLLGGADEATLVSELRAAYSLDDDRARADVAAFLRSLRDRELLTDR